MTDGAHLNIGAEKAVETILGGEDEPEHLTDEQFEQMIRTAPIKPDLGYDEGSNACARIVLEAYEKYPQLQDLPEEHIYLKFANGKTDLDNFYSINTTLYDVLRKLYDDDSYEYRWVFSELTGFMWGWAVNAARKVLGLGAVPNPALITIELKTETSDV